MDKYKGITMTIESEFKIKEILPRTYNIKSFRLEVKEWLDFKAGQFLRVSLEADKELKRYLSISSSPTEKGYIEFTKKITESEFSKTLDSLEVGDYVRIQYPFGKFTLDEKFSKVAFISGGIGITPIRSIVKFIVDANKDVDTVLIYANRNVNDIAFRQDFEAMQERCPKLKVIHVLSEATKEIPCKVGRVDKQIIKDCIADCTQRKFYLCGPAAMVEAMRKILTDELGISRQNIVTENFQGY